MIKLFTHTDLDGIGCEIVARLLAKDVLDIEYCENSEVDGKISKFIRSDFTDKYRSIWITDLRIADTTAKLLNDRRYDIGIAFVDHHASSQYMNYEWAIVELANNAGAKQCGTSLLFREMIRECSLVDERIFKNLSKFAELVRLWDTWEWKTNEENGSSAEKLNDLFVMLGADKFVDSMLNSISECESFPAYTSSERHLIDYRNSLRSDYISNKCEKAIKIDTKWGRVAIVFAEQFVSQLGNTLCENNKDIQFAAIICPDYNTVSLRSVGRGADVSKIAEYFGGGGHRNAAGFSISKDLVFRPVETLFKEAESSESN